MMEFAKLQKSPEDILEETLESLCKHFEGLSTSTRQFSKSLKDFYDNSDGHVTNPKIQEELTKLQEESKSDFLEYQINTIPECDDFATGVQNLFTFYKGSYNEWCDHESLLQKLAEEYQARIDSLLSTHESLVKKTKNRVEKSNKNISELKAAILASTQQEQLLRSQRNACQQYPIASLLLFIPRQLRRCFRYLCSKKSCCCCTSPQRTTSYETLVKNKDNPVSPSMSKDFNKSEDGIREKTKTLLTCSEGVVDLLRDVSNAMSHIYQELCRLDYHEANKEKHYEIMAGRFESITRQCRFYIASLTNLRSDISSLHFDENE